MDQCEPPIPASLADVPEGAIAVIEKEYIRAVIAEEDVLVAIVVDISDDDAMAVSGEAQARRLGRVLKVVVAQVLVEPVGALRRPQRQERPVAKYSRACRRYRNRRSPPPSRSRSGRDAPRSCPEKCTKSIPAWRAISANRKGLDACGRPVFSRVETSSVPAVSGIEIAMGSSLGGWADRLGSARKPMVIK